MKKILIIEDNLEIRENTAEILEIEGFEVVGAENGKEGIRIAYTLKPDVILCDIMMPETNGYEVIQNLKSNPSTAKIPFIYVTASGEKTEVSMALKMGANGYIRKPFDATELVHVINECLIRP